MRDIVRPGGFDRRRFLKATSQAGLLGAAQGAALSAFGQTVRSSDRPAVAVIGLGSRGQGLAEWQTPPFADVLAICDVDLRKTGKIAQTIFERTGRKVEVVQDYRRLLDRKDIHAIVNATCDHWHAKISVEACRAGKDLYCEKPLSLTIDEGKVVRKVVSETGRVVQVGTQQRSELQFQVACGLVRSGRIGKLKQVGVIVPGGGFPSLTGACVPAPVPTDLNWDVWLGQAPAREFSPARLNYREWFDYGGGFITDWGAHYMDIAHWGMGGEEVGPLNVEARGYGPGFGKPNHPDQFRPFAARLEYPDGVEMWFVSQYRPPKAPELKSELDRIYANVPAHLLEIQVREGGVLFTGSQGSIFVGRQQTIAEGIGEMQKLPLAEDPMVRWHASLYAHMRNFVESVRTRQRPLSYVSEQHRTLIPCHLTNIALRLGRKLSWNSKREVFDGDREANAMLRREQRKPYQVEA